MDLGLKGKKVVLTGGGRGIGRATLDILAEEGCDIAFFSRKSEDVKKAADAIAARGRRAFGEAFDMQAGPEAYVQWLKQAAANLGGCDIFIPMVSASGSGATGDWQKCFDFDVMGAARGCEALGPELEASGAGSIVLLSSSASVETFIRPQAYNAMKGALLVYAKQLGQALGAKGVRVNVVSPGPVEFPGGNWPRIKANSPEFYQKTVDQVALRRLGAAEDVAKAVVFLASPAAAFITGTNLMVDGGFTKRVQF
jgi:NAD(P)-dependent dehydrogenase (short-subunit alcohol dehydrogenase family)